MPSFTKSCRHLILVSVALVFFINTTDAQKTISLGYPNYALNVHNGVTMGDSYYFTALNNPIDNNYELWKTDGTQNGTIKLTNGIELYADVPYKDKFLTVHNGLVYFEAKNEANGKELWRTDGTVAGTFMLDIRPGPASAFYDDKYSSEFNFIPFILGNSILFIANDGVHGIELWRTDGTTAGTYMVKDINSDTANYSYNLSTKIGNIIYFMVPDNDGYADLYRTDGTTQGTYRIFSSFKGEELYDVAGTLYFTYRPTNFAHKQLWKTDGTEEGTVLISDNGNCESNVAVLNNTIYFVVSNSFLQPVRKYALYKTDGTEAGTELVKDSIPFYNDSGINLRVLNNRLLFFLQNSPQGQNSTKILELWNSDGTPEGTGVFYQHYPKINGLYAGYQEHDRMIYTWMAIDGHYETWITDGSPAGTQTLRNFGPDAPANESAFLWHMFYWKNKFLLRFIENEYNDYWVRPIWMSDGTTAGTIPFTKFDDKYGLEATVSLSMAVFNESVLLGAGQDLYIYTDPTLVAPQLSTPVCTGNAYTVTNKAKGTFEANNTFSVQLSNASGSFSSPISIGSVSAAEDGDIPVTIPLNITAGAHYRIRIVSTNPAFVGADNGTDIQVKVSGVAPVVSTTALTNLCPPQSIILTSNACAGALNWIPSGSGTSLVVSPTVTTTYKATCTSNGCTSAQSNGITVNVANSMYTLKSGNWNDPAVWSCGVIPTETRDVLIKSGHKIALLNNMGIQKCKNLAVESGAVFQNEGSYFLSKP